MFGRRRGEVTRGKGRLRDEELHYYCDHIREDGMGATWGDSD
jgi:hypothetical protein